MLLGGKKYMISRSQLKGRSKDQLRGRWGLAIGVVLVGLILMSGFNIGANLKRTYDSFEQSNIVPSVNNSVFSSMTIFANLWALVLSGVFTLGMKIFLINFTTGKNQAGIRNLFEGFNVYLKALGMSILVGLIIFIGCILLIIPGIIFALMYSQAFYILADDSSKSITDCMTESREMMVGHKAELFVLYLSFIGWFILGSIPFGIGLLWVNPYAEVTYTNYYLELKNEKYSSESSGNQY